MAFAEILVMWVVQKKRIENQKMDFSLHYILQKPIGIMASKKS